MDGALSQRPALEDDKAPMLLPGGPGASLSLAAGF